MLRLGGAQGSRRSRESGRQLLLKRALFAEGLGTALLLAIVIGSGVMAERLAGGNVALALLANTLATVGGLYVLIEVFGPVSGAHFNPAVSAVMAWRGELPVAALLPYVAAQLSGALLGAWLAPQKMGPNKLVRGFVVGAVGMSLVLVAMYGVPDGLDLGRLQRALRVVAPLVIGPTLLLAVVTLVVGWLLYLGWPRLTTSERLGRTAVLLLAVALFLTTVFPR